jgi:hypothetical protein
MLRWFWWRINAWTEIASMAASLGFFVLLRATEPALETALFQGRDVLNDQTRMLLIAACTIATWIVVTWLTPPESREVLQRFYRKVRPAPGGWGPVARSLPEVRADQDFVPSLVAALASSAMVYATLIALGRAILDGPRAAALPTAVACACGLAVWRLARRLWQTAAAEAVDPAATLATGEAPAE